MDRLEHLARRLGFTLGVEDRRLLGGLGGEDGRRLPALRGQDRRLLLALGGRDLRLLDALGVDDHGTTLALGAHLLLHRLLDRARRIDRLQLDPVHAQAPALGCLVEDDAEVRVDLVARGERVLERDRADHVAQCRHGQLLDREQEARDLVRRPEGIGHGEVEDRIDRDRHVVLRDHRLRRERNHLLAHVDERPEAVDERDEEVQARIEGAVVAPEALDDAGARLRHDPDRPHEGDQDDQPDADADHDGCDGGCAHGSTLVGWADEARSPDDRLKPVAG